VISDNSLIDGLLDIETDFAERALPQRFGSVQLDILNTTISSSGNLVVSAEIISDKFFKLFPFFFFLIEQFLIFIGPFPLLKFKEVFVCIFYYADFRDVSVRRVIEVVLVVLG
jgi:hypothetical protein